MITPGQPRARLRWQTEAGPQVFPLKMGEIVTIGRDEGNVITLNDAGVSRRHASVLWNGSKFAVRDLRSSNGTFVNGHRIQNMDWALENGDEIKLHEAVLVYEFIEAEDSTGDARDMATIFGVSAPQLQGPSLSVDAGPDAGQVFPLTGEAVVIGRASRDATWEIRLSDRAVSRPHVRIERRGGGFVVVDLGSANGTTINDKLITAPTTLQDGDVVSLGETRLVFHMI